MTWLTPVHIIILMLLTYLAAATAYRVFIAFAYFLVKEPKSGKVDALLRFAVLVPAHDEELLIGRLCKSLLSIDYPRDLYEIFVIADNCKDRTASVCSSFPVKVLERNDKDRAGKGHAIEWALDRFGLEKFEAVLIIDADNLVDPNVLSELNLLLAKGERAIQCQNAVGNREDSWFTQLLFVARNIDNLLYHHSKFKLGLSSYLMGNGICFSRDLLATRRWKSYSVGEDYEYYARLIDDGIKIGYAVNAKVFHQESKSLEQATTQRLRWSSGRFNILKKYGCRLLLSGLKKFDIFTIDASLPLIFPNYSLQVNLTLLFLLLSIFFSGGRFRVFLVSLGACLMIGQAGLFATGVILSKSYAEVLKAVLRAPFFLVWKGSIDFLSFTGIYRGRKWIRTTRHVIENAEKSSEAEN